MSEVDPNGIAQHASGAKLDAGKVDVSLLTLWPRALMEVCRVGSLGQSKYSRGGFLDVANGVIRYTAAMLRHLFKESMGQKYDDDPYYDTPNGAQWKGTIRHDAQVAWNALSRLELKLKEEEQNEKQQRSSGCANPAGAVIAIPPVYADPFGGGLPQGTSVIGFAGDLSKPIEHGRAGDHSARFHY
jgi:hypothetical protein